MSFRTYLSATEMSFHFSNFSEYTSDEQTYALQQSYLMVNSYVRSNLTIPSVEVWDEVSNTVISPSILKSAQATFARYILENQTLGFNEDLELMKASTVEMLRELRDGELGIETQTFEVNAGYNIVSSDTAGSGSLELYSDNTYTGYEKFITIEIDNSATGALYPYSSYNTTNYATYRWKTNDVGDWIEDTITCKNTWLTEESIMFRFVGALSAGDSFVIQCIPNENVNATPADSKLFHQSQILY